MPVSDEKAINIVPTGMENIKNAGYYYERSKVLRDDPKKYKEIFQGDKVIEKKNAISTFGEKKEFKADFEVESGLEGWD